MCLPGSFTAMGRDGCRRSRSAARVHSATVEVNVSSGMVLPVWPKYSSQQSLQRFCHFCPVSFAETPQRASYKTVIEGKQLKTENRRCRQAGCFLVAGRNVQGARGAARRG